MSTIRVECPVCGPQEAAVTGYEPAEVQEDGSATVVVHFRLTPDTCEHIRAATEEDQ